MPEGNEIHRWAERHAAAFAGKGVRVDGPQGRFRDSDVLDGRKLRRVMAVGKHLGYDFGKGRVVFTAVGHTVHAMWNPQYLEIQKRSVRWLLKQI